MKLEKIVGVEIQEEVWEMANRTVKLNNLEDRVEIVKGDIKTIDKQLAVHGYPRSNFKSTIYAYEWNTKPK